MDYSSVYSFTCCVKKIKVEVKGVSLGQSKDISVMSDGSSDGNAICVSKINVVTTVAITVISYKMSSNADGLVF